MYVSIANLKPQTKTKCTSLDALLPDGCATIRVIEHTNTLYNVGSTGSCARITTTNRKEEWCHAIETGFDQLNDVSPLDHYSTICHLQN